MVSAQVVGDGKDDAGCPVDVSAEVNLELPVHCQMGEALAPVQGPMLLRYWDMEGKGRLEVQVWQEKPEVTVGGGVAQNLGRRLPRDNPALARTGRALPPPSHPRRPVR